MGHYIIPVFVSHAGCPHTCVFCNQTRINMTGREEAFTRAFDSVMELSHSYLETIGRKKGESDGNTVELSFFGGTFTAVPDLQRKSLLRAGRKLKEDGLIDHIRCSTRPDYIDSEILKEVKDSGMDIIELGVQSLDEDVLRLSGRGHGRREVEEASRLIKNEGMILGHQVMPGLPGATPSKDFETAHISSLMGPDIVRIYPTLVIKDTPLEDMYLRGDYIPYTLEEAVDVTSSMLSIYEMRGVKPIRLGLQATDEIAPGRSLAGGPWHPAFSELVRGKRLVGNIRKYLEFLCPDYLDQIILAVNPKDISVLYAGGRRYFRTIGIMKGRVMQDPSVRRGILEIRRGRDLPDIEICI